jgi:hypothetical protein
MTFSLGTVKGATAIIALRCGKLSGRFQDSGNAAQSESRWLHDFPKSDVRPASDPVQVDRSDKTRTPGLRGTGLGNPLGRKAPFQHGWPARVPIRTALQIADNVAPINHVSNVPKPLLKDAT